MKKLLALTLFILVINPPVWNQTYFNHRFEFEPGYWEGAQAIFLQPDGYIIGGGYSYWETPTRLGITKLDFSGNRIFTKLYFDSIIHYYLGPGSFIEISEDTIIAVGTKRQDIVPWYFDQGVLYFFTNSFDTIKTCLYGESSEPYDTSYILYHCKKDSSGYLILAGQQTEYETGKNKALLIKTDVKGNPVWEKTYTDGTSWQGYSVICTSDGGYAIGGFNRQILPPPNFTGDPLVIKTDSAGNMQWYKLFGDKWIDYIAKVCNSSDGNIIVGTSYCDTMIGGGGPNTGEPKRRINIIKLDNDGNAIWDKKYSDSEYDKRLSNIRENPDGSLIACGITNQFFPYAYRQVGWILKTTADGDSLWYRQYNICYGEQTSHWLYDVLEAPDKGYIACGVVYAMPPDTGNQDAWVIKVDSIGCVSQDECWVGIPTETTREQQASLTIYPNPAKDYFTVEYHFDPSPNQGFISIYDIHGKMMGSYQISGKDNQEIIPIEHLKPGLYVVTLYINGKTIDSRKISVIR